MSTDCTCMPKRDLPHDCDAEDPDVLRCLGCHGLFSRARLIDVGAGDFVCPACDHASLREAVAFTRADIEAREAQGISKDADTETTRAHCAICGEGKTLDHLVPYGEPPRLTCFRCATRDQATMRSEREDDLPEDVPSATPPTTMTEDADRAEEAAIAAVIRHAGEFAHALETPEEVAEDWAEFAFTAPEVEAWLGARCFDPAAAYVLKSANIGPDRVAAITTSTEMAGTYVDTLGYKYANGDIDLTKLLALLSDSD